MLDPAAVYVCVATYNRNDQLAALLTSLRELDSAPPQVLVVDNNPEPLAEETVSSGFPGGTYIHQPEPGIATARNAALDALPSDAQAVIFVDDDERVHPRWLSALLDCADTSGADVVYGPVLSVLPEDPPEWLKRWELDGPGYIRRVDFETGPWDRRPATNNSLVRAEWFTRRGLRFDEAFNFSGGSDSDLFQTMIDAGAVIWWCAEAVVEEDVPPSRVTKAWLRQRQQRLGHMRVMQKSKRGRSRASLFLEGTARIGFGLTLWPRRWITRQKVSYSDRGYLRQGIGMVKATVGLTYEEYARRDSAPPV